MHNLAVAFGFPAKATQDFLSAIWLVFSPLSDAILLFEDGSGALHNLAMAFGIPEKAAQNFLQKIYGAFSKIIATAKQLYAIITSVFSGISSGIGRAIDWIIKKVAQLNAALANIKLPKALTPGSPTPFEMGLRGISSAMDDLSRKSLPKLNAGMNVSQNASGGNGGINNYTDNRRFSAGMDANALRIALDAKFKKISDAL